MLIVNNVECPIADEQRIRSSKALLHPAGEIHTLLDEHHRVGTGLLDGLDQLHYIGSIAVCAALHLLVVPAEVLGRVAASKPSALRSLYSQSSCAQVPSAA